MATVIRRSASRLQQEREALLKRAGMSEDELRRRAEGYQLTSEQMDLLDAVDNIDYLLRG